jgi:hypothetical protein
MYLEKLILKEVICVLRPSLPLLRLDDSDDEKVSKGLFTRVGLGEMAVGSGLLGSRAALTVEERI